MSMKDILREGFRSVVKDDEVTETLMGICEAVAGTYNAGSASPLMEAADGKGKEYDTLKDMAMWLLVEGTALNVIHWNVDRNNKHELLDEAYNLCRDTGDKLAETYIALTDKDIKVTRSPALPSTSAKDSDVLAHLKDIQKKMQGAVEKNPKFSEGVKNIFADFDEAITTIIYKWSRFGA
jgi:DNA-binding ferritin-like protein